ncbi:DUF6498-containing protein [Propioniciclava sp.]|uniref:DUF6498-containing protein n=1 Tax=Propioniciclava sp. TaxID=2038686 RepID=UPI00262C4183|nr:DUF6498-containing protein [Propioniciclava sp.]
MARFSMTVPAPVGNKRDLVGGLLLNLVLLAGVLVWGWPAGNVLLLFWVENVVMGAITVVKIMTARNGGQRRPGFFALHYGLFCAVHFVFVAFLSFAMGARLSFLGFLVPVILIMLRHLVDLLSVWFGSGLRQVATAEEAFAAPYPRMIILHVTTIIAWGLALSTGMFFGVGQNGVAGGLFGGILDAVRDFSAGLGFTLTDQQVLVVAVILVKTGVELGLGWSMIARSRRGAHAPEAGPA